MHLYTLSVLAAGALAAPAGHVLHEKRAYVPESWVKMEAVEPKAVFPMRIGLTQQNLDKGHDLLMEVSEQDSPKYGQHYSAEEVADIFAPAQHSVDAVKQWLEDAGISRERVSQSWNKQWIQFDALAHEVEDLLKTKYHVYEHRAFGKKNIACDEYHVPAHVQEHVDYITPGIKLFATKPKNAKGQLEKRIFGVTEPGNASPPLLKDLPAPLPSILKEALDTTCQQAVTPTCIQTFYNITKPTKKAPGNQLGIFESLGDVYSQTDLNLFFQSLASNIPQGTGPELRAIDGATAPNSVATAGPESDLDFEISYPIIYPQGTVLFQTDDPPTQANYTYAGFFNNFLDAIDGSYCTFEYAGIKGNSPGLDPSYPDPAPGGYKGQLQCGKYKPTNVISISYGGQEPDLPTNYQQRQCQEFLKLGMQGVSIVIASGDSGVSGRPTDTDNGCIGNSKTVFNPDFPAGCPYLTTAGATYLPTGGSAAKDEEVAVTRFPSGGGFSNIYPRPSYQDKAVSTYLSAHKPTYPSYNTSGTNYPSETITNNGKKIYNAGGRGYPDVSAVGDNVVIYTMGLPTLIGGTSASAPVFAAVLNRINEERIAAGKKTIGFVNPVLYANPGVFHDITVGNNPGCGTNGFNVSKGWDPVTGLGTPNYPQLLKLFMSLS